MATELEVIEEALAAEAARNSARDPLIQSAPPISVDMPVVPPDSAQGLPARNPGPSKSTVQNVTEAPATQINEMMAMERALAESQTLGERATGLASRVAGGAADATTTVAEQFNRGIAGLLGYPVELVNEALGYAGQNFLANPGDAQAALRRGFDAVGLRTGRPAKTLGEKMGAEVLPTMLTIFGLRGAAGLRSTSPAAASPTVVGNVANRMLDEVVERPATSMVAGMAGIPGRVVGSEMGEEVGAVVGRAAGSERIGRGIGSAIGGIAGDVTTGFPTTMAAQGVRVRGRQVLPSILPEGERIPQIRAQQSGAIDNSIDPELARQIARDSLQRETDAIDTQIAAAVDRAGRPMHGGSPRRPEVEATAFRNELEGVYRGARNIETQMWQRVPRNVTIETQEAIDLNALARRIATSEQSTFDPAAEPRNAIASILRATEDGTMAGAIVPRQPTVGELLTIRSMILREHREAGGSIVTGRQPIRQLQAQLSQLEDAILDTIQRRIGSTDVDRAREFTRLLNDRFRRGPVGALLSEDFQGAPRVLPQQSIQELMGTVGGLRAAREAGDFYTAAQPQRQRNPAAPMNIAADDAVRAEYRDAVQEAMAAEFRGDPAAIAANRSAAGVNAANRFMRKHGDEIEAFTAASRDLRTATTEINTHIARRDEISRGALARYGVRNPPAAIRDLVNTPDVRDVARGTRELTAAFRNDPDARRGFQRAVIEHLLDQTKKDMHSASLLAQGDRWQALLRNAFDRTELDRIERILNIGAALQRGETPRGMAYARNASTAFAHITGLHAGRAVAAATGSGPAGSLSLPARMSNIFTRWAAQLFASTDPMETVARMVVDPDFEAMMLRKMPNNLSEARRYSLDAQKLLRRLQASRLAMSNSIFQEAEQNERNERNKK